MAAHQAQRKLRVDHPQGNARVVKIVHDELAKALRIHHIQHLQAVRLEEVILFGQDARSYLETRRRLR